MEKRIGYLIVSLCIGDDHELVLLMINTIQTDLKSMNYIEVCSALSVVGYLVNEETIPAVKPLVVNLLKHPNAVVRKRAVVALRAFQLKDPGSVSHLGAEVRASMCDKDPSVMYASLSVLYPMMKAEPLDFKGFVGSLVNILNQILEHRLPRDYDYHRIPAPWLQIQLLKMLRFLGEDDEAASKEMYGVLGEVMHRVSTGVNVGYAVLSECFRTITSIYPSSTLITTAASKISHMLESESNNVKYLGLNALVDIVKISPEYAVEHQMVVVNCLDDPDETIQRKTIELLSKLTTPQSVEAIIERLTRFIRKTHDRVLKTDLASKVCDLSEKYAPSTSWYVNTLLDLLVLAGEVVPSNHVQMFLRLVAEGSGEDEGEDEELRKYCVNQLYLVLEEPVLQDVVVQVASWILGEYSYLVPEIPTNDILGRLCETIDRPLDHDSTRGWIITSLLKLVSQTQQYPPVVHEVVERYSRSRCSDVQQRCSEFKHAVEMLSELEYILPQDGSCEEIDVDSSLSFLDPIVMQARSRGMPEYKSKEDRFMDQHKSSGLKLEAYAAPERARPLVPEAHVFSQPSLPIAVDPSTGVTPKKAGDSLPDASDQIDPREALRRASGGAKVWGPGGLNVDMKIVATPTIPSTSATTPAAGVSTLPLSAIVSKDEQKLVESGKTPEKKTVPKRKTQKEVFAESIFGGVKSAEKKPSADRKRTTTKPLSRGKKVAETKPSDEMDVMLDLSGGEAPSQPPAKKEEEDLLSFLSDVSVPPARDPAPVPQPVAPKPPVASSSGGGQEFLLDDLLGPSSSAGSGNTETENVPTLPMQPMHTAGFGFGFVASSAHPMTQLCGDSNALVEYYIEKKENAIELHLEMQNLRMVPLQSFSLDIQPPSMTDTRIECDAPLSLRGHAILMDSFPPTGKLKAKFTIRPTSVKFSTLLAGRMSYRGDHGKVTVVPVHKDLSISSFINRLQLTTPQFGERWVQLPHEKKGSISTAGRLSLSSVQRVFEARCGLNVIEVIGQEMVAAGQIVGINVSCYAHCAVMDAQCVVTVRCSEYALSEMLFRHIQSTGLHLT
eukprot:TRINITY_DN80_c0_g2_i1.p1 TRINITY_DN80_c0_g2~~TRINITY_DN80_c0_g2_i1.p1  ORF type:complete len:1180 (+),score=336.70 TRINITY_DN80_c0_g2_i1:356-3541(+)